MTYLGLVALRVGYQCLGYHQCQCQASLVPGRVFYLSLATYPPQSTALTHRKLLFFNPVPLCLSVCACVCVRVQVIQLGQQEGVMI